MQQRIVPLVYLLRIEYFCFCITVHILEYAGWSFNCSAAEDISMYVKYATILLRCTVAGVGLESMRSCSGEELNMKVCAEEGWTRKYAVLQWREATDLEVCASLCSSLWLDSTKDDVKQIMQNWHFVFFCKEVFLAVGTSGDGVGG